MRAVPSPARQCAPRYADGPDQSAPRPRPASPAARRASPVRPPARPTSTRPAPEAAAAVSPRALHGRWGWVKAGRPGDRRGRSRDRPGRLPECLDVPAHCRGIQIQSEGQIGEPDRCQRGQLRQHPVATAVKTVGHLSARLGQPADGGKERSLEAQLLIHYPIVNQLVAHNN